MALAGIGLSVANSTLHRVFARHGITLKGQGMALRNPDHSRPAPANP